MVELLVKVVQRVEVRLKREEKSFCRIGVFSPYGLCFGDMIVPHGIGEPARSVVLLGVCVELSCRGLRKLKYRTALDTGHAEKVTHDAIARARRDPASLKNSPNGAHPNTSLDPC